MKSVSTLVDSLLVAIRRHWPGWFVASALVVAMLDSISGSGHLLWLAGVLYWLALLGLWPRVSDRGRRQTKLVVAASIPGLFVGIASDAAVSWSGILTAHASMLSMLVAVGFMTLQPESHNERPLRGLPGKLATFLNVHMIGAVINYSAVIIFGDRLTRGGQLTPSQALLLSRAFAAAGFWSPFFATTATALAYAPEAKVFHLLCCGLVLALLALILSLRGGNQPGDRTADFVGIGLSTSGLRRPAIVCGVVGVLHLLRPDWGIPSIITVISPILACLTWRRVKTLPAALVDHVNHRLPAMATELALFLSAGMLGVSLMVWLSLVSPMWTLSEFGSIQGCIALVVTLLASLVGIHPLISIAAFGRLAHTTEFNADVLAFTVLSAWAIGSTAGPLSGQNLGIQGRYGIDARTLTRSNLGYVACLSFGAFVCLAWLD